MKVPVVFVTCFFIAEGFVFTSDYKNVTRLKRQSAKCQTLEFECQTGQCISEDYVCDGKEDCNDGSDETAACKNNTCPPYVFRCAYGACINSDAKCDGKKDCKDNSDEAPSICKGDTQKPGNCEIDQFQCNNGQCINEEDQCDGVDNCDDGSDETVETCASVRCPKYSFKCDYGACINPDLRCNGINNCKDKSDEQGCSGTKPIPDKPKPTPPTPTQKPPPKVPTGNDCLLPDYPNHGKWMLLVQAALHPGDIVGYGTVLTFVCNTNYRLMPDTEYAVCSKTWSSIPKCIRTCPSLSKKDNLVITCIYQGSLVSCDNPYDGTKATVKCADLYEDPSIQTRPYRFCQDGSWDYPLPTCEPVCGLKSVDAQQLVINGKNATRGEFPWHVGIFQNYENICGGSIITPKLVLSAAHCFESTATEIYLVGAGKYFRKFNETKDDQAQFSKITQLLIHEDYNGGHPYEAYDLAVLVLANPFQMTKYVLPVCLDSTDIDLSNLINRVGIVIGWGWTLETGKASDNLKYLEVEYKNKQSCSLPQDFVQYYLPYAQDKLCAGLLNKGQSACKGDSGGSLVFPNNFGRYVLRGIVSVAPRRGSGCDSNQYTLYTSILYHINYIEQLRSKYRL